MVVDVDQFGVQFVRDLHTVFPSLKMVVLSRSPKTLARSLKAGAAVALPRSIPNAVLGAVISRLLRSPKATHRPAPHKTSHPAKHPKPPARWTRGADTGYARSNG